MVLIFFVISKGQLPKMKCNPKLGCLLEDVTTTCMSDMKLIVCPLYCNF